jgi:NTE family protein
MNLAPLSCLFSVCVLAFSIGLSTQAQKVGLVLGGGGAKGLSHIGVLKALEENHIPIHYVTGTSIGAIVGGLYAAGYSPTEIEEIALSGKFEEWASGLIDDKFYYYYLQDEPNPSMGGIRFEYDSVWRTILPSSLRSPLIMDFVVQQYFATANAASGNNFDHLMIPFRCVAADITNNRPLVLKQGDLGRAVRASMTFPFIFKPIRIDGKLLYDGGMYNNFPADVMFEEFYPDMIIGSKAADNYGPPSDDNLITHLQNMLMEKADFSVICENSILIQPDLSAFSVMRFSNPKAIIDSGYFETLRQIGNIRMFISDSITPLDAAKRRQAFRELSPPLLIDGWQIAGLNHIQFKFVNNYFKRNLRMGKDRKIPNSINVVKDEYLKLAALDLFRRSDPTILPDTSSQFYYLHLDMEQKGNLSATFGGVISTNPINEAFMEVKYRFLRRNIHTASVNTHFGRFYNSLNLQERIDLPLAQDIYILGAMTINHWNFFKTSTAFIEDNTPSYLIERDKHGRILFGKGIGTKGKAEIDLASGFLTFEYFNTSNYRSKDTLDRTAFGFFSPGLNLEFNTLNRKAYPDQGVRFSTHIRHISGTEYHRPGSTSLLTENSFHNQRWFSFVTSYEAFHPIDNRWTWGFAAEAAFSNQKPFNNFTASILYAPLWVPVPEASTLFKPQIRAYSYFALGGRLIYKVSKSTDVRFETHIFNPYREITTNEQQEAVIRENYENVYGIMALAGVLHTPIGPLSLNVNYYHKSPAPVSASINFGYILFNRKAWFKS